MSMISQCGEPAVQHDGIPNHADLHEPNHAPKLGLGPVIKHHANQSYATNMSTEAWIKRAALEVIPLQDFCVRSDMRCGSTIGNIAASKLGMQTVDIGAPILGMHSTVETGCTKDHLAMVDLLKRLLTHGPGKRS